jgi:FkbM family methyltransferase
MPPIRRPLLVIIKDRWSERALFGGLLGTAKHLYSRCLSRWPGAPLPGRGKVVRVNLRSIGPVELRLGTSDFFVALELVKPQGNGDYDRVRDPDLGPVRSVMDLGTNIGLSIRLWQSIWPDALIVGVEPDRDSHALALRNIELGPAPTNVVITQACVGASRRSVSLNRTLGPIGYKMDPDANAEQIPVITMDDLAATMPAVTSFDVIKMDIEGAEQEILSLPSAWIDRAKLSIIEIHPPYTEAQFRADIDQHHPTLAIERVRAEGQVVLFSLTKRPA